MEDRKTKVQVKNIAHTPQKLRLVADLIRGKDVNEALNILQFTNRKGTDILRKAVLSGIANARELFSAEKEQLKITHLSVGQAPTLKRVRFASRGRVSKIKKRRSHINLELTVKE
ncbi:50S ribosomal protein L22 [candidate division WS6 bacterium RIFOXYD1_FULL_33_8]|uniref:Large ribosomal subunit protein uL22 n=1 Tax=candidate division WS6 bacterium GW2011_GWC1_33_20 TaxID=1619089 RepID=A0A0G0A062_9BACT|nr:ribosomal protein L22 [uncultured bacterium]KKP42853.1 MAG: 50S ribosomal protein L22, large subunit ribosomal protein L22 [candidate division WS6 bacterium GW2011_GWE2_33_157]KKP44561.1 MAG: 50S ribosomal protein L22, large subunit ribosomal protein L22 [candidate division WS6 bacterium GW2011_GWC1_33_20]OGC35956.1 MAG: 50S ribosomal protein L22 [candidate division WS6 bacterium RIFOXYB1_FULL_33_15]OGC42737.1 MAG: 50S ribosomal protein L22 [candidate division WS6 bacterium RIFOXYD1_FULL_33_